MPGNASETSRQAGSDYLVAIHDGVRPLVSHDTIWRCFADAEEFGNAVPFIEPADSVRILAGDDSRPVARTEVRLIQTPQVFRGSVIIDQNKIRAISQGSGSMKSRLDVAADKAHRLTEALRAQKIEAYEFHDRHESIVTVGSFESVGDPRADGKIEIKPSILQIMEAYGPRRQQLPNGGSAQLAGLQPKTLAGIPFDVQPRPVHVPRRSIAADYSRSKLF